MTTNKECEELLAELGIFPLTEMLEQLHREIQEELVAICSNLAKPCGAVIDELLPQHVDLIRCLSYEIGAIKPEQEIYDWIVRKSGVQAEQTLFVGDTQWADYEGPLKYGFRALHLVRNQPSRGDAIASLEEILDQW